VSSHILAEVERMADRVLVMVNGRLVAEGTPEGVQQLLAQSARTLRVETDDPRRLASLLLADATVDSVTVEVDHVLVHTSDGARLATLLPVVARDAGVRLRRLIPIGEDLESVFSRLTASARGAGR
jgi:ABC-2 type transport system ATP-binding protein